MLIPNKLRTNYELLRLNGNDITVRNTIQTTIKFEHTLSAQITNILEPILESQETTLTSVRVYKDYFIFNTKESDVISNIMKTYIIKTYKAYFHYTDIYTIEISSVHLINTDITYKGVQ